MQRIVDDKGIVSLKLGMKQSIYVIFEREFL